MLVKDGELRLGRSDRTNDEESNPQLLCLLKYSLFIDNFFSLGYSAPMSEEVKTPSILRRLTPAPTLVLLAPLVAEYLLGDFRVTQLGPFPVLALTYGCCAVLIRELVRRSGQGWPAFVALAMAYGLIAEGIVDQSLFNPDFMHLHILAYGFWPILGTSPFWAISVITGHVAWSMAVPVGMTESLFPAQSRQPWLGRVGLVVTGLLYLLGSVAIAAYFRRTATHHASAPQTAVCVALIVGLIAAAFLLPRPQPILGERYVRVAPIWIGAVGFVVGSLFVSLYGIGAFILHWPAIVTATVAAGLDALIVLLLWKAAPRSWTPLQVWAATTGGLLVYAWHGYVVDRALHGPTHIAGHTLIVVALCSVQAIAWFRVARFSALHPA
jgi:hypothetical protein